MTKITVPKKKKKIDILQKSDLAVTKMFKKKQSKGWMINMKTLKQR